MSQESIKIWRKWRDWRLEEEKIPMGFAGYKNYFDIIETAPLFLEISLIKFLMFSIEFGL